MSDQNQSISISRLLETPLFKGIYDQDKWRNKARCKDTDMNLFFSESKGAGNMYFEARCICFQCPVQKNCLDFAVDNSIDNGIWGGMPYRERLKYHRGARSHKLTIRELINSMKSAGSIKALSERLNVTENYIRNQLKKGR